MEGVRDSDQLDWAVFGNDMEKGGGDTDWTLSVNGTFEALQDPLERTRLESSDFDEWQDFTSTRRRGKSDPFPAVKANHGVKTSVSNVSCNGLPNDTQARALNSKDSLETPNFSKTVLKDCFPTDGASFPVDGRQDVCIHWDESSLSNLRTTTLSLSSFKWSRCLIKDQFLLTLLSLEEEKKAEGKVLEELDLSGYDEFDWSLPQELQTPPQHKLEHLDSGSDSGVRFSPDDEGMQGLLRAPFSGMDSPIQIEFDYGKAVLGLSMLSWTDLQMMKDEMAAKISKQSNELVVLLQKRDVLQLETVTKNKFIQALLKVKGSKHAMQHSSMSLGSLGATGGGDSGTGGGTAKEEERPRSRSRPRSLQNLSKSIISHTLARAKNLLPVEEDKTSNNMLLHVVIPYKDNMGDSWSVPLLKQWTKILQAMAENNPNVSHLISDYLTMAIDSRSQTGIKS